MLSVTTTQHVNDPDMLHLRTAYKIVKHLVSYEHRLCTASLSAYALMAKVRTGQNRRLTECCGIWHSLADDS